MKKQIKSAFVIIVAAVALAGSHLAASARTPQHIEVNVPFDFVVGDQRLPAGRYRVSRVNVDSESALRIQSADGRVRATALTNAARGTSKRATLTFRQYGDQHFLAAVALPGAAAARELPASNRERALRAESQTIALAGRE